MQSYGFFNSVNNDRVYDASDVADFLSKYFTNGVFNNGLNVSANDNLTVSVDVGYANINGYSYKNSEPLVLNISESDTELSRIDSIVLRLDLTNRMITAQIIEGAYATTPSAPTIVRTGTIYDLRLANITVSAGATRITSEDIEDTRFGTDCGAVTQAVLELDTSEIFAQYQAYFDSWFTNLQNQLDDNQAGHLQNEIDDINDTIEEIEGKLPTVENEYSTSTENGYSCDYINNQIEEVVLFNSEEGNVELEIDVSESFANFEYIELYSSCGYTKVYNPNGKSTKIATFMRSDTIYYNSVTYSFNDKKITTSYNKSWHNTTVNNNTNKLHRVVGKRKKIID